MSGLLRMTFDRGLGEPCCKASYSWGERAARFFLRLFRPRDDVRVVAQRINGEPGLLVFEHGQAVAALIFAFREQKLWRMYSIRNPDKLTRLPLLQ